MYVCVLSAPKSGWIVKSHTKGPASWLKQIQICLLFFLQWKLKLYFFSLLLPSFLSTVTYRGALKRSFSISPPAVAELQAQRSITLSSVMQGWATRCYGSWEAAIPPPSSAPQRWGNGDENALKCHPSILLCPKTVLRWLPAQPSQPRDGSSHCSVVLLFPLSWYWWQRHSRNATKSPQTWGPS